MNVDLMEAINVIANIALKATVWETRESNSSSTEGK